MQSVVCHTSGRSQGNPGPAGIGIVIFDADGTLIHEEARSIGNATDNYAEYYAIMICLQLLEQYLEHESLTTDLEVKLDNEIVQQQLAHLSQINEPGLIPMFIEIHNLRVAHFPNLHFTHISHEENKEASERASKAIHAAARR